MKMTESMALSRVSFLSSPFSRRNSENHVLSESEVNEKYAFAPCSMSDSRVGKSYFIGGGGERVNIFKEY